jgi:hypothetical protein
LQPLSESEQFAAAEALRFCQLSGAPKTPATGAVLSIRTTYEPIDELLLALSHA